MVLAGGTAAAACAAALFVTGLPVLAPVLRDELGLSLGELGLVLAAAWIGSTLTLLPWGLAADRYGERAVLALGLAVCAACLVAVAYAPGLASLLVLLALAGAAGSSVNSASGRAVMHWFPAGERGLALGIRQTAIPLGGLVGALAVPPIAEAGGSDAAFLFLGGLCAAGAVSGAVLLRAREPADGVEASTVLGTLADGRLWRLCAGSGLYLYAQAVVLGFAVVFLHDEHGFSDGRAALVLAVSQVLAVGLRLGAGRWSDVVGSRVRPLRRLGLAVSASLFLTAALAGGPVALLVAALAAAGGLTMAWNGLSFAAAAELAGARRSGAAIGLQQTALSAVGVAAPIAFAAVVSATSWEVGFLTAALVPLAGWVALRPLQAH
ncbi:MAG TPA: MFS transporter [Gaiellaceae bacterium]|nr:MFS transporter [Gaiellaceae bacterium]